MPTLAVVMIMRNEATWLPSCLASVAPVSDAIVIGDTGSTDASTTIAAQFGAVVVAVPWEDDFAAARNAVLEHAKADWLLHMDADEELDPETAAAIRGLVDRDGDGADAIEVILANYCNDPRAWRWLPCASDNTYSRGKAGCIPVPLLRLFRGNRGFAYREPVHESITASVREQHGRILQTELLIHHHGFEPAADLRDKKRQRYLTIARKKAAANPGDVKAQHDLAEQALACGEVAEAEAACRHVLGLAAGQLEATLTLANILLNRGTLEEARGLLEVIAGQHDAPAAVFTALGAIALRQGDHPGARKRLNEALQRDPRQLMGRLYLARYYDLEDKREHARRELALTRDLAPAIAESRHRLEAHELRAKAERLFEMAYVDEALQTITQALQRDPEDPVLYNDAGVLLHQLGQLEKARENFQRALRLAPGYNAARENLHALSE